MDEQAKTMRAHMLTISMIILGVLLLGFLGFWVMYHYDFSAGQKPELGVTFNNAYAEYLGLNWRETYIDVMDDAGAKHLRLSAPWNEIEPAFEQYNFTNIEWQLQEAQRRNVSVIMVVGRRTPRWPECHDPVWLKNLSEERRQNEQLEMVEQTVKRLRTFPNIVMWQVENEPFLDSFGECTSISLALLKKEVALVKSLDERPVMVTDSGELSMWIQSAQVGDKFGHTLYRTVYQKFFGYFNWMLPPLFYRTKAAMLGLSKDDVLVAELQAEPWIPEGQSFSNAAALRKIMSVEKMESNVEFGQKTGARAMYLWGAEWWYYMKTVKDDSSYWELAKKLFNEYP